MAHILRALVGKTRAFLFAPLICVALNAYAIESDGELEQTDYRLGIGDTLSIEVFGEPDLSLTAKIDESGDISFPLLGTIKSIDLTASELREELLRQLGDGYLINPRVSLNIAEYRQYFIYGEVKGPGAYNYQPGLNLQRAVVLAGGFTERASTSKFYLLEEGETDPDKKRKITLTSVIEPGDIVTVEQSFF